MGHPRLAAALCALAVLFVSTATSTPPGYGPPRPGTEGNGLTENESATLWSRDDDRYITNDAYRAAYGENRTAIQEVANATDLTFKRPPATAATWTRNDFADLHAGGSDESIYPPGADLESEGVIQDAHATLFAAQPSTRVHHDRATDTLYVAPNGTARGLVDYRVGLPDVETGPNTTVRWQLDTHGITEVRLEHDGRVVARTDGTHMPQLDYRLSDSVTADATSDLTLAADIHVAGRLVRINRSGNETTREAERIDETVTVEDTVPVRVHDLEATVYRAEFPDGDAGVAVFQNQPWQGYWLTENGSARVRGVWRFYTARDTQWDRLVVAEQNDSETIPSPAHPVFVHAYPSELGPRPDPAGVGPSLQIVWGTTAASPASALGPNVAVEVVEAPYTASYGMAVRHTTVAPDGPTVRGIVRGVTANVTTATDGVQQVRHHVVGAGLKVLAGVLAGAKLTSALKHVVDAQLDAGELRGPSL